MARVLGSKVQGYRLWVIGYELWVIGYELWVQDSGLFLKVVV
jgi:hypothetical protein